MGLRASLRVDQSPSLCRYRPDLEILVLFACNPIEKLQCEATSLHAKALRSQKFVETCSKIVVDRPEDLLGDSRETYTFLKMYYQEIMGEIHREF